MVTNFGARREFCRGEEIGRRPTVLMNSANKTAAVSTGDLGALGAETTRKLQLLHVGSIQVGVLAEDIATIREWQQPTPLPKSPRAVLGVVSIQGRMLTVMDLLPILDVAESQDGLSLDYIAALRGDEQLALAIERVGETVTIALSEIEPAETEAGPVIGVVNRDDLSIRILDVKNLFPAAIRGRERRDRNL